MSRGSGKHGGKKEPNKIKKKNHYATANGLYSYCFLACWLLPTDTVLCPGEKQLLLEEHRPGDRHGARRSPPILRGKGQPWGAKDLPSFVPPTPVLFCPIHPLSNEPDHWALKAEKHFIVPDCKRLAPHRKGQSPSLVCRIVSVNK